MFLFSEVYVLAAPLGSISGWVAISLSYNAIVSGDCMFFFAAIFHPSKLISESLLEDLRFLANE